MAMDFSPIRLALIEGERSDDDGTQLLLEHVSAAMQLLEPTKDYDVDWFGDMR